MAWTRIKRAVDALRGKDVDGDYDDGPMLDEELLDGIVGRERGKPSKPAPMSTGVVTELSIENPQLPDGPPQPLPATCKRNGNYRVSFRWDDTPGGSALLDLRTIHQDSPMMNTAKPYVGSLCEHELEYFLSVPGAMHTNSWQFKVTDLDATKEDRERRNAARRERRKKGTDDGASDSASTERGVRTDDNGDDATGEC